jgi:Lon protease-like protein
MEPLPLLPLPLVLFPGESLPVTLSDPRLRRLAAECAERDCPLGVVLVSAELPGEALRLCRVGTAGRIVEMRETMEGALWLRIVGTRRFTLHEAAEDGEGLLGWVTYPEEQQAPAAGAELLRDLFGVYRQALGSLRNAVAPVPGELPDDDGLVAYVVAQRISASVADRQRLLECDAAERTAAAVHLLRRELDLLRLMAEDSGAS